MDAMGRIATALDDAHQVWRNRGVRSRHLLSLLLEFDNGRFLNEASRERLYTDINGLTLVSITKLGEKQSLTQHN